MCILRMALSAICMHAWYCTRRFFRRGGKGNISDWDHSECKAFPLDFLSLRVACFSSSPTQPSERTTSRPQELIMASQILDSDPSNLITRLENLRHAVPKDEATRKRLFNATRNLVFALETPGESIQRIAYSVRIPYQQRRFHTWGFNSNCTLDQ